MIKNKLYFGISLIFLIFLAQAISALSIVSVNTQDILPGEETSIRINIENTFEKDIEEVSLSLNFQGLPISSIGSSEDLIKRLNEDEDDSFIFKVRSFPTAEPGDYKIPFTLSYKGADKPRTGTINLRINGNVELSSVVSSDKPVIGLEDKLSVKIINKGFADARYVSIKILPLGFSLYSEDSVYIGDIRSNDFETATFDIKHNSKDPVLEILVEYRDFNNEKKSMAIKEKLAVYTKEEAIKEGIIKKDKTMFYLSSIIALIIVFLIWKAVRKHIRRKRSLQYQGQR